MISKVLLEEADCIEGGRDLKRRQRDALGTGRPFYICMLQRFILKIISMQNHRLRFLYMFILSLQEIQM